MSFWREVGQTVRAALTTWHGTVRLGVLLILFSPPGPAWGMTTLAVSQFWGDFFGDCTDKFGINWMVNIGQNAN